MATKFVDVKVFKAYCPDCKVEIDLQPHSPEMRKAIVKRRTLFCPKCGKESGTKFSIEKKKLQVFG